ncbi:DUF2787 family protein [Aliivibrio fischeri]|uniref:DUF2787 family protein n=1 Tax=Aliivibrio fischeri TaxID=668 RepID=UPI0012D8EB3E|nr:DUF2787 family protein [Aliivibrio fischeri]MUJ20328.1 DUF2787 domain-containing protein [Aliivibrio fischeri]
MKIFAHSHPQVKLPVVATEFISDAITKIKETQSINTGEYVVFNYRDKNYSADNGGFHPVEIAVQMSKDENDECTALLAYVTSFCFDGSNHYPELIKCCDYDFENGYSTHTLLGGVFTQTDKVGTKEANENFEIFFKNFVEYVGIGALMLDGVSC